MNPHLDEDALSFGAVARRAFSAAGGVDLARRAEADPSLRSSEIATLLDRLGLSDIDARLDRASAEAAAALCREAGRVVLPYPIVPLVLGRLALCDRIDGEAEPTGERPSKHSTMIRSEAARHPEDGPTYPRASFPMVDHGDLVDEWRLADVDATAVRGASDGTRLGTRLGPFVGCVSGGGRVDVTTTEIALHLTLTGFVIAGALTAALELATGHVTERVQFDKPLSSFQAVQFQLADA
ncbi:MAG: hypothetical protein M3Z46_08355, partial [Actinomycetota bacterium]|nr:hypothetical protein [Actinomycetota bacterium]